ncbi:MAG: hypothetical protein AAFO91_16140, partial [Bacteroidota bacterium]
MKNLLYISFFLLIGLWSCSEESLDPEQQDRFRFGYGATGASNLAFDSNSLGREGAGTTQGPQDVPGLGENPFIAVNDEPISTFSVDA